MGCRNNNMRLHLFAHMDKNKVKAGDHVRAYENIIGTVGDGNGSYPNAAHLHYSISENLSEKELLGYVNGWSKEKVKKYFIDPGKIVDFDKMFNGKSVDVGNRGYDYLQKLIAPQKGYHPGVDVNGHGGGSTDFGMPFKSPVNGVVVYEKRTSSKNGGWGNIIIIEEVEGNTINTGVPEVEDDTELGVEYIDVSDKERYLACESTLEELQEDLDTTVFHKEQALDRIAELENENSVLNKKNRKLYTENLKLKEDAVENMTASEVFALWFKKLMK